MFQERFTLLSLLRLFRVFGIVLPWLRVLATFSYSTVVADRSRRGVVRGCFCSRFRLYCWLFGPYLSLPLLKLSLSLLFLTLSLLSFLPVPLPQFSLFPAHTLFIFVRLRVVVMWERLSLRLFKVGTFGNWFLLKWVFMPYLSFWSALANFSGFGCFRLGIKVSKQSVLSLLSEVFVAGESF